MSPLELSKNQILRQLHRLCAHCATKRPHRCPDHDISARVQAIHGVPLMVNNEFKGVLWR